MTTAEPQHARPSRLRETWRGFRRWRRNRPFWGGLLTVLAGLEIFGTTQMSLGGLTFQMGPTGFLSWLIPTILVTCGLLIWFSPQQRIFYAVVAAITALYSLIGVNLGGFLIGLLLGVVGSALAFAWTLDPRTPGSAASDLPGSEEPTLEYVPPAQPGPDRPRLALVEETPPTEPPLRAAQPARAENGPHRPEADPPAPGPRDPRLLAVLLGLVGLSAAAALAAPAPAHAAVPAGWAAAAPATPTACPTRPAPAGSKSPTRPAAPRPTASPSAGPSADADEGEDDGNIITDILGGIGDLLGIGDDDEEAPAASPSASPTATARPTPTGTPKPRPTASACPQPTPSAGDEAEPGQPLPRVAADPGQPRVNAVPSKLTGSKVTMTGLRFEGIVDLPTAVGTLKALKFSMARAVTDDFLLRVPGPAGRTMSFATGQLTVRGNVDFYATRFSGKLLGIRLTLTPDLPFPDGLPITSPIPISFTDPEMDLAFVTSDTLTAKPRLRLTLT
ncbi:DUF6114 domain-containing protein [Micromonospora sp. NPDC126480]|uniref:DUF6114 domain-containing protein n=1 Tax=Micromonospora sp. NPDC126480 TaxID=3155312 RepID=UPI00332C7F7B